MNFKEFISWFSLKSLLNRLFLVILIVKPFLDTFHDLSIFGEITLLKLVGALIFFVCLHSIFLKRRIIYGPGLNLIFIWGFIYTINLLLVLLFNFSLETLSLVFKMGGTVYVLYYFFREIQSERDVLGYLYAYFLSLFFLIGGFAYSDFFIRESEVTRGAERIITVFGDIATIGVQYNIGLIVIIFLANANSHLKVRSLIPSLVPIYILVGFYILLKIHHTASYLIFFSLLTYYVISSARLNFARMTFLAIAVSVPVTIWYYDEISQNLLNLVNTDLEVVQGVKGTDAAFHGRGQRWARHWKNFTGGSFLNYFFGLVGIEHPELIGHGPHNDYLRLTFSSGLIGSISFILFNLRVILNVGFSKTNTGIKFGIIAILVFWFLQAVSLTPSSYHAFNFAYGPLIILSLKWKTFQK